MAIKKITRIILGYKNENKPIPAAPQKCPPPTEILIVTMVAITWSSKCLAFACAFRSAYSLSYHHQRPTKKESAWNTMFSSVIFILIIQILYWNLPNVNPYSYFTWSFCHKPIKKKRRPSHFGRTDGRVRDKPILNHKQKSWDTRLPKRQLYKKVLSIIEHQCQDIISESSWFN